MVAQGGDGSQPNGDGARTSLRGALGAAAAPWKARHAEATKVPASVDEIPSAAAAAAAPAPPAPVHSAAAPTRQREPTRVDVQRLPRQVEHGSPAAPAALLTPGIPAPLPATAAALPAGPGTPAHQDPVTGVETGGSTERADWVRQLLEGLWPYMRQAAEGMAWEAIPPQLEASRPPFVYELRMDRFSLGDARPAIHNIRVHGGGGAGLDQLFVEFEAEWRSQQDVTLHITVPRLPVALAEVTPDAVEDALHLLLQLRVALKDAWVKAGVRVTLSPLLRRLPVVGAVQVSLTRLPEFGYNLDLSLASAALAPLLHGWLDSALRDMVLQPWVLPEHYFLPIDPKVRDVERPTGVLAVRVVGADDVPRPGLLSTAQPLVELFLRDTQRRQTHVAQVAGGAADWGARFEFPISVPEHQTLTAVLLSYADWTPNDELGRAQLALRDLPPDGQEREVVLEVQAKAEEAHDEEQQRMGLAGRLAMVLGRPFTKRGGAAVCRLRLQVCYVALSEAESRLIMEQQHLPVSLRAGRAAVSRGGAQLHPLALRLLRSGLLVVAVRRAEGMLAGRSAAWLKPYYKAVVRVGGGRWHAESDAARANRQGAAEFSLPVSLHLPEEAAREEAAQVEVELLEHSWVGQASSCGVVELPLRDLVEGRRVEGVRRVTEGPRSTQLHLTARFQPYF